MISSSKRSHPRQKGMRRSTYERLAAELYDAMELHNQLFALEAAPILVRFMKTPRVTIATGERPGLY